MKNDDDLLRDAFGALRAADHAPPFERVARPRRRRSIAPVLAIVAAAAAILLWVVTRPRPIRGEWHEPELTMRALREPEVGSVLAGVHVPGEEDR